MAAAKPANVNERMIYMKKSKQVFPLLLTAALLFSSAVSFPACAEDTAKTLIQDTEQRRDWQRKLYPESFIGEYEQACENDVFTVWVWVKDKTEEYDAARLVYEETGLTAGNITSVSEEEYQAELETWSEEDEKLLSKEAPEYSKRVMLESRIKQRKTAEYISAFRRIGKEITSISNNDILKTLDLKEDEILYVSTDAPIMVLSLSKPEIERIAQYEDVNSIEHVGGLSDIRQYGSDDEYYGSFSERKDSLKDAFTSGDIDGDAAVTSNDALLILRASVDMAELLPHQRFIADVDNDGDITANDALIVLRKSIGIDDGGNIEKGIT